MLCCIKTILLKQKRPLLSFDASLFWRGPCWLNTAYFAVKGLANYGFGSLALHYCGHILSWIEKEGFWEYYDTRRNCGIGQKDFSWSSVFGVLFAFLYKELEEKYNLL